MEKVLIDLFSVPSESRAAFLEQAYQAQRIIRTLSGYVEGFIFEQVGSDSPYDFMTTAVWESEAAFENAKEAVRLEYQRQGYNLQETLVQLKVQKIRATYYRSSY